jgi:hypothetical protein
VRIPPHFSDCVAFVCERAKRGNRPGGTAFFIELDEGRRTWTYLVTALHNIDEIYGSDVYVRVNTHTEIQAPLGFEDIQTRKDDWFQHDRADVAVILSPIEPQRHAIQRVPADLFVNARYRFDAARMSGRGNPALEASLSATFPDGIDVQVGDEIFFPGLFVQSAGNNRNLPVVRFGHVARMPGDEFVVLGTKRGGEREVRAYLAETHSWSGYSGSPVFWHFEYNITAALTAMRAQTPQSPLALSSRAPEPERVNVMISRGWATALLGLVSGHYDVPTKSKDERVETLLNAGIAIITPAENIRELLMREDVVEHRNRVAEEENESAATADFASDGSNEQSTLAPNPKDRIKIPILTRGQFEHDLKKAARKRKP